MAAPVIEYINYIIYFTDPAQYNFALGLTNGVGAIQLDPFHAAQLFNIPWPPPSGNLETIPSTIQVAGATYTSTGGNDPIPFIITKQDPVSGLIGEPTTINFSLSIPSIQFKSYDTGFPPLILPPDTQFIWSGVIIKANFAGNSASATPIPQRRWIGGAEMVIAGEGGTNGQIQSLCRDSSRTMDGLGFAVRGQNTNTSWSRTVAQYRAGLAPHTSWERFYVRFRRAGTGNQPFWQCFGVQNPVSGFALQYNTDGTVHGLNVNAGGSVVDTGVVWTPVLNTWYLVDILIKFDTGVGTDGRIVIYLNHVFTFSYIDVTSFGLNANTAHLSSNLGRNQAVVDNQIEIDLDDWINADLASNFSATTLATLPNTDFSLDWKVGSHVKLQYSNSDSQVNWTGGRGTLNQGISPGTNNTSVLTSSTAAASIDGTTDVAVIGTQNQVAGVIGAVAAIISERSQSSSATAVDSIGYAIAGGANQLTTFTQGTSFNFTSILYAPIGLLQPAEISPFHVIHQKSNDVFTDTIQHLQSIVEYIGIWGNEDDPNLTVPIRTNGYTHNARYLNTPWGIYDPVSPSPVIVVGATYTGNGTYQEIILPAACHFLWIRNTTTGTVGGRLFASSLAVGAGATTADTPNLRVWFDDSVGQFKFSVTGSDTEWNQNTLVYQYIAFCDPGMRFNVTGAFQHPNPFNVGNNTRVITLLDPQFLAQAAFAQSEQVHIGSGSAGLWYKGPGMSGNTGVSLAGSNIANFGSLNTGQFISGSDIMPAVSQVNFSLWRSNEIVCTRVMCQLYSYIGDGNTSKIVTATPASGRYPLFVMVMPTNNNFGYFRDPSHTGNASSNTTNLSQSSTGIISAGIDTITVGTSLNTLNVTYSVFCIPGDSLGFNNGTFYNPDCVIPIGTRPTPVIPPTVVQLGNGGLIIGGSTGQTLLKDVSGIYTIIPGKLNDSLIDRQSGQTGLDINIPDPTFKTGYIGG